MRRIIALTACLLAGCFAALALTAQTARAGLTCATDTAAAVAGATLTNRGLAWSSPEHPDPTWSVDIPSLSASYDLQAPDDAGARAAVKAILDGQLAAMGCGVTTTVPTTAQATTTAPATTTATPVTTTVVSTQTQTTTATQTVSTPPVIVVVPSPAQTVTATVTTPSRTVTVKAAPAKCPSPATKKKGAR